MESTSLTRFGGLAALVGGATSTTLGLLYVLQARGVTFDPTERALQKGHYETPVATMLLVGVLAAIAALHALQRRHYGPQGALAALSAFFGLAIFIAVWFLAERVAPITLAGPVGVVCLVVASAGIAVLGIVTISAGVLPRWCGAALIAGSPPVVGIVFVFSTLLVAAGILPGEIGWTLAGLPWVLVGYAIFQARSAQQEQPSRVR